MAGSDDTLRVVVQADVAGVQNAMDTASNAVKSASVKMAESFKAASLSANDAISAMKNLGFSAEESSAALRQVGLVSAGAAAQIETTAVSLTGMDRAMAMATGRIAGMSVGAGMLGGALGRIGAASAALGPILSAAFPVFGAIALADVTGILWEKLRKLSMEGLENADAWQKINHEAAAAMESASTAIDSLEAHLAGLNSGRMAELEMQMKHIGDGAIEMSGKMLSYFDAIGGQLEKETTWLEKIKEFVTFINTSGFVVPNQGEIAKAFGSELSETLDTKGLAAGIELVSSEVARLNGIIAKNPGDKALKEYADQLIKVLSLLEQRVTLEEKQKQVNQAEQGKEHEKELRESANASIEYANATHRLTMEKERLADSEKKLAEEQAIFGAKNDGSAEEIRDSEVAAAAVRQFRQDRLTDEKNAAVESIALEENMVREKLRLGQVGNSQAAAQLKELEAQKLTIEKQYLDSRIGEILTRLKNEDGEAYAEDLRAWSKLLSDKLKAEMDYQKAIQNTTNAANLALEKSSAAMIKSVGNDFSHGIVSWMNGQETFGRAMQHVWTQFADTAVSSLLKVGFQMVANAALGNAIEDGTRLHDAAAAARKTWVAVANIPVVGPFLAPEAAAAAFAGVMAFEEGGMVPGYGPVHAIVHGGEMILNADQQRALGGGGGNTFHFNHYGPGTSDQVRDSSKEFVKMAARELRRRNFGNGSGGGLRG